MLQDSTSISSVAPTAALSYRLPSLDSLHSQAGSYWPGAASSTPASQGLQNLPTPPTDATEAHKPLGQNREAPFQNMAAAAAVQHPPMASNFDHPPHASSLTARRPAANNLPSMIELPMPPFGNQPVSKPVPVSNFHPTTTAQASVGNLLTPPSTVPGDSVSPISSLIGSTSSASQAVPPYSNVSAWLPPPPTVSTPLGLSSGTGTTPNSWTNSLRGSGMFSPSLFPTLQGNTTSPSARTEGVPPPPYDVSSLPPFSAHGPMSAPTTLPAISSQQPLSYMSQNQAQVHSQASLPNSSPAAPMSGSDPYMNRPQSTPTTYYSHSQPASAVQPSFPLFNATSPPIQQSPLSAPLTNSRLSPVTPQGATFAPSSSQYGYRAQLSAYNLAARQSGSQSAPLNGPVLTNMHTQNNQMAMVGLPSHPMSQGALANGIPLTSGQVAQMFGNVHQQPPNERPFKCDQCPQSFNRNHDLKRHKRIHLAVKPFPCMHCDKSFSRKDALKVRLRFSS